MSYELVQTLQHEPNLKELADSTDQTVDEVSQLMNYNYSTVSVDAPLGNREEVDLTVLDTLSKDSSIDDPIELIHKKQTTQGLGDWLGFLPDQSREVLELRFGLAGYEPSTLEQVSKRIGLTRERVRQIQIQALVKLKKIMQQNDYNWEDVSKFIN